MGLWHVWLPPLVLWGPESYPALSRLKVRAPEGYPPLSRLKGRAGAPIKKIADIDAWRPEASMTGWPGWLACLAWLGWLGWKIGMIGSNSNTLDALKRSADFLRLGIVPSWVSSP